MIIQFLNHEMIVRFNVDYAEGLNDHEGSEF